MRNDINLKTTWVISDNESELYFEFYNINAKFVGNVIVSNNGKISWDIIDLNYEDNIKDLINYIMCNDNIKKAHYESNSEDKERWKNACMYIYLHSLLVNRKYNFENNIEKTR